MIPYAKRGSFMEGLFWATGVAVIVAGIFVVAWLRTNITAAEYTIGQLEAERARIMRKQKALVARKAVMLSLRNIEEDVEGRLGLVMRGSTDRAINIEDLRQGASLDEALRASGEYEAGRAETVAVQYDEAVEVPPAIEVIKGKGGR